VSAKKTEARDVMPAVKDEPEMSLEQSLRPQGLSDDEYINQEKVKANLRILIEAANQIIAVIVRFIAEVVVPIRCCIELDLVVEHHRCFPSLRFAFPTHCYFVTNTMRRKSSLLPGTRF